MPFIPAVCENGHIYSTLEVSEGAQWSFVDVFFECPSCRANGIVPRGVNTIVNDILYYLGPDHVSKESISILIDILKDIKSKRLDIMSKKAPELKSILDFIPKTRADLLLSIITLYKSKDKDANLMIEKRIKERTKDKNPSMTNRSFITYKIIENALCPCGSGKKYRLCHGLI
jgi:hypothetical protein